MLRRIVEWLDDEWGSLTEAEEIAFKQLVDWLESKMKTSKIDDGIYEIVGTELLVSRNEEWSIVHKKRPHDALLTGKSKADAINRLETIKKALLEWNGSTL